MTTRRDPKWFMPAFKPMETEAGEVKEASNV